MWKRIPQLMQRQLDPEERAVLHCILLPTEKNDVINTVCTQSDY